MRAAKLLLQCRIPCCIMVSAMPARKKPTPEKYCEFCGKRLERKRLPNGDLEYLIHFNRRKYCNQICMGKAFDAKPVKDDPAWMTAHHHARKICPRGPCVKCGRPMASDVHHKDENFQNNSPANLERICRSCHIRLHRKQNFCSVCGKPAKGLGYCDKHYQRFKKYGDPFMFKRNQHSPLTRLDD